MEITLERKKCLYRRVDGEHAKVENGSKSCQCSLAIDIIYHLLFTSAVRNVHVLCIDATDYSDIFSLSLVNVFYKAFLWNCSTYKGSLPRP